MFAGIEPGNVSCGEGWKLILERLCATIAALELPELRVVQIKQKLGELRFYVTGITEDAHDAVAVAQLEALATCEECGAVKGTHGAQPRPYTDWLGALCERCRDVRASS
jgi:hypothetical protein